MTEWKTKQEVRKQYADWSNEELRTLLEYNWCDKEWLDKATRKQMVEGLVDLYPEAAYPLELAGKV